MKLFEPITIRSLELKNRIVMLANGILARGLGLSDPTEAVTAFYGMRVKGAVGAFIIGFLTPLAFISDEECKRFFSLQ